MNNKKIYIPLIALILLAIFYRFFYVSVGDEQKEYHLVFLKKSEGKIKSALVLYYLYPSALLYIYDIDVEKTKVLKEGEYLSLNNSESFFLNEIKKILLLPRIDHTFHLSDEIEQQIFDVIGGVDFFNLYSDSLPKGEVFIDDINYEDFLEGIKEEHLRKDTTVSIWINALVHLRNKIAEDEVFSKQLKEVFSHFKVDLNYLSFLKLVKPFITKKNYQVVYSKMNLDSLSYKGENYLVPLNEGEYDRRKINRQLLSWINEENGYTPFPITVQVRNATPVSRLAAKTTGVFRFKRLSVVEYLNSSFLLDNSIIVSHLISPLKENYVKKTSRIEKIYYLVNYLDDFDFSIFLGNNFYGVESVRQENRKTS